VSGSLPESDPGCIVLAPRAIALPGPTASRGHAVCPWYRAIPVLLVVAAIRARLSPLAVLADRTRLAAGAGAGAGWTGGSRRAAEYKRAAEPNRAAESIRAAGCKSVADPKPVAAIRLASDPRFAPPTLARLAMDAAMTRISNLVAVSRLVGGSHRPAVLSELAAVSGLAGPAAAARRVGIHRPAAVAGLAAVPRLVSAAWRTAGCRLAEAGRKGTAGCRRIAWCCTPAVRWPAAVSGLVAEPKPAWVAELTAGLGLTAIFGLAAGTGACCGKASAGARPRNDERVVILYADGGCPQS